jgi:predicted nucleotidyltransferase
MTERIPREKLTARLERLITRVEATPERIVERKTSLHPSLDVRGPVRVRIESIWTFGSYARGAQLCGDIDLIIKARMSWAGPHTLNGITREGNSLLPSLCKVISPLIGPLHRITWIDYDDLMQKMKVLDEVKIMEEAILLWQPRMNWRGAIEAIKVNPKAGRAKRPATQEEAERIAEKRNLRRSINQATPKNNLRNKLDI